MLGGGINGSLGYELDQLVCFKLAQYYYYHGIDVSPFKAFVSLTVFIVFKMSQSTEAINFDDYISSIVSLTQLNLVLF